MPPQEHQDLVFDAARGVGGQFDFFAGIEGVDRLDQTDGADAYQVFDIYAGVFELAGYVDHQPQVMFDQALPGLMVAGGQLHEETPFLLAAERRRQNVAAADIIHPLPHGQRAAQAQQQDIQLPAAQKPHAAPSFPCSKRAGFTTA